MNNAHTLHNTSYYVILHTYITVVHNYKLLHDKMAKNYRCHTNLTSDVNDKLVIRHSHVTMIAIVSFNRYFNGTGSNSARVVQWWSLEFVGGPLCNNRSSRNQHHASRFGRNSLYVVHTLRSLRNLGPKVRPHNRFHSDQIWFLRRWSFTCSGKKFSNRN